MSDAPIILLAHIAGCIAAAAVMEWRLGFDKTGLWRLLYPVSVPAMLVVLPYLAWTSRRHRVGVPTRGLSLLTAMGLRMWIAYVAGAASVIIALRLARF